MLIMYSSLFINLATLQHATTCNYFFEINSKDITVENDDKLVAVAINDCSCLKESTVIKVEKWVSISSFAA